ncbi:TPA: hypothetical protein ACVB8O_002124, partial [Acinetobacter baumannii]
KKKSKLVINGKSYTGNNVTVNGDAGEVKTVSGGVRCGHVMGNAISTSGNIRCHYVNGNIHTVSGDVDKSFF